MLLIKRDLLFDRRPVKGGKVRHIQLIPRQPEARHVEALLNGGGTQGGEAR